jgi:hypothetical protein
MTRMLDTAAAARLANATTATIRNWCRQGRVAAVKTGRRWTVELSSLLHRLNGELPRLAGWLRTGEWTPVRSGRTLRRYEARHAARTGRHRAASHYERALMLEANAGRTTALGYLRAIGFPEAERYASAYGREVAKQYRINHKAEPYKGCLVIVRGRMQQVFGYADVADLYTGAYSYARTREFLASQRAASMHALAA